MPVLIVDRHVLHAEALAHTLHGAGGLTAVSAQGDESCLEAVRRWRPDAVVVGETDDPDRLCGRIHAARRSTRIIRLTDRATSDVVTSAAAAGCVGVVERSAGVMGLTDALRSVLSGGVAFPRHRPYRPARPDSITSLTDRELQVLVLIDHGLSTRGIADQLALSPHTIRNHVQRIFEKLEAHSRIEALAIARRQHLLAEVAA